MKKFIFAAITVLGLSANAEVLQAVSIEDTQVPVSMVFDHQNVQFGPLTGAFTTVFRGSAAGLSEVFLTLGESLEDEQLTYSFQNVIGTPENIQYAVASDSSYTLSFDVNAAEYDEELGYYVGKPSTITLLVNLDTEGWIQSVERQ